MDEGVAMKKIATLLSIVAVAGCGKLKIKLPPVPPSWDAETCEPSDYAYVAMAKETRDRPPALRLGMTPEDAHVESLSRLKSMGYELTVGRPPGYEVATDPDQLFCGTTLPGHVYISQECYDKKEADKSHLSWATFLRHEETHARQQVRMLLYFFAVYGYGEGRLLGLETPAYNVEFDTYAFFMENYPELDLATPTEEDFTSSAAGIYDQYSGAHIPKECFVGIATAIWSER